MSFIIIGYEGLQRDFVLYVDTEDVREPVEINEDRKTRTFVLNE